MGGYLAHTLTCLTVCYIGSCCESQYYMHCEELCQVHVRHVAYRTRQQAERLY